MDKYYKNGITFLSDIANEVYLKNKKQEISLFNLPQEIRDISTISWDAGKTSTIINNIDIQAVEYMPIGVGSITTGNTDISNNIYMPINNSNLIVNNIDQSNIIAMPVNQTSYTITILED